MIQDSPRQIGDPTLAIETEKPGATPGFLCDSKLCGYARGSVHIFHQYVNFSIKILSGFASIRRESAWLN